MSLGDRVMLGSILGTLSILSIFYSAYVSVLIAQEQGFRADAARMELGIISSEFTSRRDETNLGFNYILVPALS
jgi:hypothetical protein